MSVRNRIPKLIPALKDDVWVLRFSYRGIQHHFSFGAGKIAKNVAIAMSLKIRNDILSGNFDFSLEKYKAKPVSARQLKEKAQPKTFLEVWDTWVESLDLPDHTQANHYATVRVFLLRALKESDQYLIEQFVASRDTLAASTWNKRRSLLKSCYEWAIANNHLSTPNPFSQLRASNKKSEYKVNPFSKDEAKLILNEIQKNHSHYFLFVLFLFSTGCRTGEAVGLKWKHLNFDQKTITICESNSKRGSGRIQKSTKTESIVVLPMTEDLKKILEQQPLYKGVPCTESYVFFSPTAKTINPDNFRERIWKPVLKKLNLQYRPLYQTRHSVLSWIANEHGLLAASKVAGHRDATMVTQHYAKFQGALELPKLL